MSVGIGAGVVEHVAEAAKAAGLVVVSTEKGTDFSGNGTVKITVSPANDASKTKLLEFSEGFDGSKPEVSSVLKEYMAELAKRMKNPMPDTYVTLHGLPVTFRAYAWPFHYSTSGADTLLVHGELKLEDGHDSPLHAKTSASMTVTFAEVVPAPEQPFAESFVYNAVRKTMDQGQLELVKSGNRQPVPLTTRYYSSKQKKFIFNDTTDKQRHEFIAKKVFWLSGVLGEGKPVWVLDPRDAQYLNTTVDELKKVAHSLASDGVITLSADTEYAMATEGLIAHKAEYEAEMQDSLNFAKPQFNEDMRAGLTNM